MPRSWEEEEEEEEEIDEYDLTQLPGVDKALAERLKREAYGSLWDIVYAEVDDLADIKRDHEGIG